MTKQALIFRDLQHAILDGGTALDRDRQGWMFDRAQWFAIAAKHTCDGSPLVIKGEAADSACWLFLDRNGASAHSLSNWYCLRYQVVTRGPAPPFDQLVAGLGRAGVRHIRLERTDEMAELIPALKRRGWLVRREEVSVSWRVDTRGLSFDQYWAERPSRLKNTYRRKVKKAGLECVIHDRIDPAIWAHTTEIFDNCWKKPDGTPELTYEFFAQEAEAGTLRLGLAYQQGKPVAVQLWTIEDGVALIHLLSYREDSKQLSAGTILSHAMFQYALDKEGVELIDFGYGDHSYKRDWMEERVPLYSVTAYHALSLSGLSAIARMLFRKLGNRRVADGGGRE